MESEAESVALAITTKVFLKEILIPTAIDKRIVKASEKVIEFCEHYIKEVMNGCCKELIEQAKEELMDNLKD